jgi:hypothetical protein
VRAEDSARGLLRFEGEWAAEGAEVGTT